MPPSRFKTVAICLDAIRLGEAAKLSMTKTAVRVLVMVATFAAAYSRRTSRREHARADPLARLGQARQADRHLPRGPTRIDK